jgi:flagellar assembly protein FliH
MTSLPSVIKARERGTSGSPSRSILVQAPKAPEDEEPSITPEEIAAMTIARAEAEAADLLAKAQAAANGICESARNEGYAAGEAEAKAVWLERSADLDEREIAMKREIEQFYEAAEPELASLSVDIARKILKQEIAQSPEAVLKVVRAAVYRVRDKEVRVLVNPADLETVRSERESLMGIADGVSSIEIVSDRRVGQGGCILDTPSGSIDARIETQLTHIAEVISKENDDKPDTPHIEP